MKLTRLAFLFILLSIFCFSIAAQTSPTESQTEKEKAAKELEKNALDLLEQAVNEAGGLKLPENRALVFTMAADLLWKKDQKRARTLFGNAAGEIIQANNTPQKTDNSNPIQGMFGRQDIHNLRRMLLMTLAAHDAEYALELLTTTRPADVAAEMQNYYSPQKTEEASNNPMTRQVRNMKVEQEFQLEQNIAARAADQDPQKGAKMIRESLVKGFSYQILPSIHKIAAKDAELANKLLSEVFAKVSGEDLLKRQNDLMFAVSLLNSFATPRRENSNNPSLSKLKVEDKTLKDLANHIADNLMKSTDFTNYFGFNNAMPVLEKLVPERVTQLEQKQAALKKQMPDTMRLFEPTRSMNDPNAAPETLIADAAKAPPQMRGILYSQAVNRAISSKDADLEKIRSLLQNLPESSERSRAIAMLDSNISRKLLEQGKTDEARKIIDRMELDNSKIEQIVALAITSFRLNTKESKEAALKLMDEAKLMVKDFPEDKDETAGLIKVAAGYAIIDPPRAFTMLLPVIEQANELIGASATLAKYNKQNQLFRDGEIIMASSFGTVGANLFGYGKQLKMLAQADLAQTRNLIGQFRRDDVRIFAKLFVAQGILKEKIGLEGGGGFFVP